MFMHVIVFASDTRAGCNPAVNPTRAMKLNLTHIQSHNKNEADEDDAQSA